MHISKDRTHRLSPRLALMLVAITIAACSGDESTSTDMQVDAPGLDLQQDVTTSSDITTASEAGADATMADSTMADSTMADSTTTEDASSSSGCPAPSDLPAMYACAEVEGLGLQLLKIQDTSSGNGFYAKTSGTTPGWDQLVIAVNLESEGTYECRENFTEIEFTTEVATGNEVKWTANDAAQSCQIVVTRAAVGPGDVYEGTFSTELPIPMSGSFQGRHN